MNDRTSNQRRALLDEMERIEAMEFGALAEEYRPGSGSGEARGPYFKHQRWENGRNVSRRVPATEAGPLREAIDGRVRFEQLSQRYVDLTVEATRGQEPGSKKNSRSKPARGSTKKPRAS